MSRAPRKLGERSGLMKNLLHFGQLALLVEHFQRSCGEIFFNSLANR